MAIALPPEIKTLLDGPNYAHLATLMVDGSPHVATVWVARDGERIITGVGPDSIKGRNTRRDPRVALTITDARDPYSMAQIRGRVVEWREDPQLAAKDAMSSGTTVDTRGLDMSRSACTRTIGPTDVRVLSLMDGRGVRYIGVVETIRR